MSKITLLVYAFACKQLTNFASNGQPNDPRPRFCYYIIFYIKIALFCQNIWSVRFFVVPLQRTFQLWNMDWGVPGWKDCQFWQSFFCSCGIIFMPICFKFSV